MAPLGAIPQTSPCATEQGGTARLGRDREVLAPTHCDSKEPCASAGMAKMNTEHGFCKSSELATCSGEKENTFIPLILGFSVWQCHSTSPALVWFGLVSHLGQREAVISQRAASPAVSGRIIHEFQPDESKLSKTRCCSVKALIYNASALTLLTLPMEGSNCLL